MTKLLFIPNGLYIQFPTPNYNNHNSHTSHIYEESYFYKHKDYKYIGAFIRIYCNKDWWKGQEEFNRLNHIIYTPTKEDFEVCFD